jgi:RNA polymerase sigma factor (sigma-70 family)
MTGAQADLVLQHLRRLGGAAHPGQPPDGQLLGRFAAQRDGAAFAALVRRHGPMVLNVCRSVLRHEHDAEDAFQATFLVLARKADSIRQPGAVAGWLYEVAHRVAVKAQADAARRRDREQKVTPMAPADPTLDMTLRDLRRVLHEELRRLPERFRLPLVLCYLEGRSQAEAAGQLGWSKGTLRGRLDRGRERLRRRLAARGVALSALLCATAVAPTAAADALVDAAVRAAAGAASPRAAALADGVTLAMVAGKLKVATAVLLAVGLVATGAGVLAHQALAARQQPVEGQKSEAGGPKPQPAAAKPPAADDKDSLAYGGRVLGPDGRPVAGAKLYLALWWGYHYEPFTAPESATTGPDGRFQFMAPKAKYDGQPTIVAAAAPNLGVGWVGLRKDDKRTDLTLKLVADDVPITGRIVDLEGKPVAGATVRLLQVMASPTEDLGPWLNAAKDKTAPPRGRDLKIEQEHLPRYTTAPSPVATTDAAGRFRLTGIGRERLAVVQLDGPTIVSQHLRIMTRPGKSFEVPDLEADPEYGHPRIDTTYYGADFRHAAAPTKPIVGVVRDKDTKKPLAGVTVRSQKLANNPLHGRHIVQTVTDNQGRYRLVGMPKGAGNKVQIVPPGGLPYLSPDVDVPDSFGLDPVTVDVELKRGVWIEGRLTDKVTGKPLRGHLMYHVRDGNPNRGDYLGFYGGLPGVATNEDGTYRIIGLPGPGQVVVWRQEHYLRGADRDDEDGPPDEFGYMPAINFGAFARVDPPKGVESVRRDITLVPGWTFTGTVLGPDGKLLAGALGCGLSGWGDWGREGMKTAEFTVRDFNPRRPRPVFFRHPETGLVGVAQPPKENGGTVTVRMEPGATVTGRLVDADGAPRAGVELILSFLLRKGPEGESYFREPVKTDAAGRFRIPTLLTGYQYHLSELSSNRMPIRGALRPGQTTDLGDVRIRRAAP